MNEEKNNIGVNNSLPPMGGVVANNNNTNSSNINNIQDKYGLPPITNFTNFNDNYTTPTVDSNVSVFDLMNQFETVNTNNTVNNVNVENNNQNSTTPVNATQTTNDALSIFNNPIATNNQGINDTQNGAIAAQPQVQVQPQVPAESHPQAQVQPQVPVELQPQIQVQPQVSVEPQPQIQVQPQAPVEPQIQAQPQLNEVQSSEQNLNVAGNQNNSFNNGSSNLEQVATNNVNNSDDGNDIFVNKPPVTISPDSGLFTSNPSPKQNIVATGEESIENPNVEPPMINNVTADFGFGGLNSNENGIVEIETTSIEEDNDLTSGFDVNNNTNNMDSTASNNNNADANNNNNDLSIQKSDSVDLDKNDNNEANVNNKKKKNHKLLFIVLALIAAALVLAYFMFFKTDKLVCGMQDYSNEEFLLDESMVARFKGNNMTDAKITQTLTFTEENLEKKDSYLEELKNQYQGLGFNVSFVENEDGFEIGMSFTKKELENWYGTSLKNSSKDKLKKEMRESGYTCK